MPKKFAPRKHSEEVRTNEEQKKEARTKVVRSTGARPKEVRLKPRVALVGAGNLASALAIELRRAGYGIDSIVVSDRPGSSSRARKLAREVKARIIRGSQARMKLDAEIVWFCVSDGAIRTAASSLGNIIWRGKIAFHSSGALGSDELSELQERGAAIASVHPLMTFVSGSRPRLEGVPFAIEGDRKAVLAARHIIGGLKGYAFAIRRSEKAAYHTWGMFLSPLFTAMLAASESVAGMAGMRPRAARERMLPILRQTLENYIRLGPAKAFSGPIARGDLATVKKHLEILQRIPAARKIYLALAEVAESDLPAKNREGLSELLRSEK